MTSQPRDPGQTNNAEKDQAELDPNDPLLTDELGNEDILDDDELAEADRLSADESMEVELVPLEGEEADEVTDDEDDNAYGESDEALPNDSEEQALRRDPSREGSRFGETIKR